MPTYNRRDVAACPDGTFYSVLAGPGIVHVRCAVSGDGTRWKIESGDAPEVVLYREDVAVQRFAGAYGAGFSALRATADSVEVYLSGGNIDDWTPVRVYAAAGAFVRFYEAPYSAQGILYIRPDGLPVMDLNQNRVIHGVTLYAVTECLGHLVGLADGGDSPAGCVVYVPPSGELHMHQVTRDIQLPPRIAVNDAGHAAVVYSGWDSPEPDAMTWEPYRPYVAPTPEPVPPPDMPPQEPPMIIIPPVNDPPPVPVELPELAPLPPSGKKRKWWQKLLAAVLGRIAK